MELRQEKEVSLWTTLFQTHPNRRRVISKRYSEKGNPAKTLTNGKAKWKIAGNHLCDCFQPFSVNSRKTPRTISLPRVKNKQQKSSLFSSTHNQH